MCEYPLRSFFIMYPIFIGLTTEAKKVFSFKRVQQDMFEIKSCVIEQRFLDSPA